MSNNPYGKHRFTIVDVDEEMIRNPYGKHRFTIVDDPSPTITKYKSKSKTKSPSKKRITSKSPKTSPKSPPWIKIGRFSVRKMKKKA